VLQLAADEAMQLLEGGQAVPATARVVTPADGSAAVSFGWDGAPTTLAAGQVISAAADSPLEAAIGPENLAWLAGPALVSVQQGTTDGVSN
jgi:hypothetical protein